MSKPTGIDEKDAHNGSRDAEEEDESTNSHSNDLVLRDGFPALLKPRDNTKKNGKKKAAWWIDETDETMTFPRWPFWSHEAAIQFNAGTTVEETLVKDCHKVFTARTRDDGASYSAGTTFFLPALMKPRCALEGLVQMIFQQHVKLLEDKSMYKPEQSGAEWWTLVLDGGYSKDQVDNKDGADNNNEAEPSKKKSYSNVGKEEEDDDETEEDDVGWHYDADYGLEDQAPGLLLHPRVGTVTYLSDCGAPTVVLDCKTPKQGKVQHLHGMSISRAWVSYPRFGKHAAFDGRLLHGAPSDVFPSREALSDIQKPPPTQQANEKEADMLQEPPSKRPKLDATTATKKAEEPRSPRITLLVNVWLNHCPLDAELLDDEIVGDLETPWQDSHDPATLFSWNPAADMTVVSEVKTASIIAQESSPPKRTADADIAGGEEALQDEIVLCNHHVQVHYGAPLEDYHSCLAQALNQDGSNNTASATSGSLVLALNDLGALTIKVGDPVSSDSDSEAEEAEEEAEEDADDEKD